VHDELIVECAEADSEAVCQMVEQSMVEAMTALFPEVPVCVEAKHSKSWKK
jgi:DNA polymerase I-like protein with 3'-5' exonuclease and polymerase domains